MTCEVKHVIAYFSQNDEEEVKMNMFEKVMIMLNAE